MNTPKILTKAFVQDAFRSMANIDRQRNLQMEFANVIEQMAITMGQINPLAQHQFSMLGQRIREVMSNALLNERGTLDEAFAGHGPYGRQVRAMVKTVEQIVPMISSGKGIIIPEHFRMMHPIEREYEEFFIHAVSNVSSSFRDQYQIRSLLNLLGRHRFKFESKDEFGGWTAESRDREEITLTQRSDYAVGYMTTFVNRGWSKEHFLHHPYDGFFIANGRDAGGVMSRLQKHLNEVFESLQIEKELTPENLLLEMQDIAKLCAWLNEENKQLENAVDLWKTLVDNYNLDPENENFPIEAVSNYSLIRDHKLNFAVQTKDSARWHIAAHFKPEDKKVEGENKPSVPMTLLTVVRQNHSYMSAEAVAQLSYTTPQPEAEFATQLHAELLSTYLSHLIRILARFSRYTLQHLQGNPL